jgi:serine/threonine protein kinase
MEELKKKRYRYNGGNGTKYYIDCATYAENTNSIQIQTLFRNVKDIDVAVLKAVATDETIKKKNRHIVVKIGTSNSLTKKEYIIGQKLGEMKISGFINYICLFSCYDDTTKTLQKITEREQPISTKQQICNAEPEEKNKKDVLVMPYINGGSFDKYKWNNDNIELLKCLMIQTVLSIGVAYERCGFLHMDLILGNVLFKKTKLETITYVFSTGKMEVPTMGYKVVIMDFEKSIIEQTKNNIKIFWRNVKTFINNIDLIQTKTHFIITENSDIVTFIQSEYKKNTFSENMIYLVQLIKNLEISFYPIPDKTTYNPNIF